MALTRPRAAQIYDIDYKQATRVVTVSNVTLAGGAPNSVDGVNLTLKDRVLVTGQSIASQNGIYFVSTLGSGSTGTWTRSTDTDATGELLGGTVVMVTEGTIYADTQWKLTTNDPIVIGTTALTFVQNYSANSISSGTSNVVVLTNANVLLSSAGTANVVDVFGTGIKITGTESVTGNITGGNLLTAGLISATGNITGNYFLGNVACASGIYATKIFNGNSEANIGVANGNANISIAGTSNVAVFANTGVYVTGVVSANGNVTGGNVLTGGIMSSTGNVTGANIVTVGAVTATGNITGSFLFGNGYYLTGVSGGGGGGIKWTTSNTAPVAPAPGDFWYNGNTSIKYQYTNDGTANYWVDQSFPTSFSTLAVTGNATIGGGLTVTGIVSSSSNVVGANIVTVGAVTATGNVTGNYVLGNGALLTGVITSVANINSGTSNVTVLSSGGNILVGVGGANIVRFTSGGIENAQANSTSNIGNATSYFNTVFAKATSAQYADLAEMYVADADYAPGTVVEFGGTEEITASSSSHSVRVAGVISTHPSYLMNATQSGENVLPVALTGRVPCRVVGQISKGDRLVAGTMSGVAEVMDMEQYQPGCIIGKALESYNSDVEGQIEIAVGRY